MSSFKLAVKVTLSQDTNKERWVHFETVPYLVSVNFIVGSVNYTVEVRLISDASNYFTTITRFRGATGISK